MEKTKVKMRDSGIEWIGKIPEDWDTKKLKHCLSRNDGGVWGEDDPMNTGVFVLRSTEIAEDGKWQINDPATRQLNANEIAGSRLKAGDLVLTKSSGSESHLGKTALVDKEMEKVGYAYSNFMQRLRTRAEVDPTFLFYALNSTVGRSQINYWGLTTSGLVNLSANVVNQFTFAFPNTERQGSLSRYLDSKISFIDLAIERKRKLIELLKEKRAAIINRAVTRGLDENVELVDSGVEWIGKVPKGWKILKFKYLGTFISGGTPATEKLEYWDGNIPWISPKDMKSDEIVDSEDHITAAGLANTAGAIVPAGSLLLVYRSGILRHSIPTAINAVDAAVNQDIRAVLLKKNVSAKYLHYLVQGKVDALLNIWSKNGATVESLEHGYVANTPMPLPSMEEQGAIAAYLDKATQLLDRISVEISRSIDLLTEYRTSLISHAVTGKIQI